MARALLIVDVQNDFTEGGALGVAGGDELAAGVSELLRVSVLRPVSERYDLVVASRDWHESHGDNGGHFALPGSTPDFVATWPEHCVQGTPGAEYHPALDLSLIDVHIRKGMGAAAYSAFEGRSTDGRALPTVLEENGVTQVDAVGIATDYCVRASVLDARQLGFRVRVLTDLIAGVAPVTSVAALKDLAAAGAEIV